MVILQFMEMDRNGDGQLDLKEFMRKIKNTEGHCPHDEFLYRFFGIIETNTHRTARYRSTRVLCLFTCLPGARRRFSSFLLPHVRFDHNRVLDHTEFSAVGGE